MTTERMAAPRLTRDACLEPGWPAVDGVRALVTTRAGGVSRAPYDALNLGLHTGDDREHVLANRHALAELAGGARFAWLEQVHGHDVVDAHAVVERLDAGDAAPRADASVTDVPGVACIVMVADCMPVLLRDVHGRAVGAAHAGWRGLAAGVLERTAHAVARKAGVGARLDAYLGPAIGPDVFEVGTDVFEVFVDAATAAERDRTGAAFVACAPGKYLADLAALARLRLARADVVAMTGGDRCTVSDPARFFSYRRDRVTGRFAGMIWIEGR
ncbi:peptidoglycan editing factor PgeF [Pararobbsia silviterrae]|uniref:Purine nucleoside phosphorylase n=1 Tax=Pararobbsia silviterrae TaxID=1792498 RepID=A0A494XVL3_9BURK|nr:peptidoglycan editing factor PgeF [Pararobbsia silviterrae]RKP54620.1 peptidoglycan editing factor PgeF [Pararobbsia silviterrae]